MVRFRLASIGASVSVMKSDREQFESSGRTSGVGRKRSSSFGCWNSFQSTRPAPGGVACETPQLRYAVTVSIPI